MTPTQYERLMNMFAAASALSGAERERFLLDQCGKDAHIYPKLIGLLRADDEPEADFDADIGQSIRAVAADFAASNQSEKAARSSLSGARLGKYELLDLIGEGGMGAVYRARQDHPRRIVAVKIIRSALSSPELVRRFEREAETLGRLHHPGIAHVYEAGFAPLEQPNPGERECNSNAPSHRPASADTTLDIRTPLSSAPRQALAALPQPYIAMEYVSGEPLNRVIHGGHWTMRQRLAFVARVCDAVHHAHAAGVIHRDLKPGNILVVESVDRNATDEGEQVEPRGPSKSNTIAGSLEPKILDFGIARMIGANDSPATLQTEIGQLVGTIPYMSPEQIAGDSRQLDIRTDVYSLGVILFELLTGRLPYDIRNCSVPEAARIIREEEPLRLSRTNSRWRSHDFDRDVETIVLKSLEKDRSRRYASAAELAADIRRFLRDEPIVARPAGSFYQMRKFAKRHRALVIGTTATMFTLLAGLVASLILFRNAVIAQRAADENSRVAQRSENEAQRLAYRSSIAAATSGLLNDDIVMAQTNLERAPLALRGWEWRHFVNRTQSPNHANFVTNLVGYFSGLVFVEERAELWCLLGFVPRPNVIERFDAGGALIGSFGISDSMLATFSANGRYYATVSPARIIRIFETRTNACVCSFTAKEGVALTRGYLTVSDNAKWLAYQHGECDIGIGAAVTRVNTDTRAAETCEMEFGTDIYVNPRGDVLVRDRNVRDLIFWPAQENTKIRVVVGEGNIRAASFSPSGTMFSAGGFGNTFGLWDTRTLTCIATGRGHRDSIERIAFSGDGRFVATASRDRTVRVWDVPTLAPRGVLNGHRASVQNVAFTNDGERIASLDLNGELHFWNRARDTDTGVLRGHQSYVYAIAFSRDGKLLASAGWDKTIRIWNPQSQRQIAELRTEMTIVERLAFGRTPRTLVAHGFSSPGFPSTECWNAEQGVLRGRIAARECPPLLTCDDREILVHLDLQTMNADLWSPESGTIRTAQIDPGEFLLTRGWETPRDADTRTIFRDEAGVFILSGDRREWQPLPATLYGGMYRVSPRALRRELIAAADAATNQVFVIDFPTRNIVAQLRGHTDEIFALAWSPDGTRLATAGRDQMIRIWDTQTWDEVAQLYGHTSYVWSLEFSPDGSQLASASGDYTVRVWDTASAPDEYLPSPP
ncbi:MAG: serine/threonine protein kinase [Phycisphaerales bacterium]|nr:serine/threonine protein kinase [Phycisphaerales bacterium]